MIEGWDDELAAKAEAATPRFCQDCGTARPAGARFCPSCGREYEGGAQTRDPRLAASMSIAPAVESQLSAAAPNRPTELAATLAGLAWIGVAVDSAYLAYLQWTFAPFAGGNENSLQGYAFVNAISAIVTLMFGAMLLTSPSRGRLSASIAWGVISVAGGVLQMAGGATHWTIFVGTAGAAVAAALAWVARNAALNST
jgi:hypothetical protein